MRLKADEIALWHVYAWWSFWLVLLAHKIIGSWEVIFLGLAVGAVVETWEVIAKDECLWLLDRALNVSSCIVGGVLALLL